MHVVTDVDDPFVSLPSEALFVDVREHPQTLAALVAELPTWHAREAESKSNGACVASALVAAREALQPQGGRIVLISASVPAVGLGQIPVRPKESRDWYNTDAELKVRMTGGGRGWGWGVRAALCASWA